MPRTQANVSQKRDRRGGVFTRPLLCLEEREILWDLPSSEGWEWRLPSPLYSLHFLWCSDDLDLEVEKKTSPPKVSAFLKKDKDSLLFMCKMIKSSPPPISHLPNLVLLMQGGIDSPAQIMLGWILQLGICWILSKQTYLAYFPCLTHYFSRNWQFPAFLFLTQPPHSLLLSCVSWKC